MSKITADVSEEEPEEFLSSGEDWTPKFTEKKRATRTSQRIRKKPRVSIEEGSSSDSGSEPTKKRKDGASKRNRCTKRLPQVGMKIVAKDFVTGGFLVLKKDVQTGDTSKHPCLWRIDGKALLQKYEPFTEKGKTLHRSTSIYTGWSPLDKDLYAPVSVQVQINTGQQLVVELNWQTLKNATMDSD